MPPSTGRGVLRDPRLWITVCLVAVLALAWQGILTALNLSVASDTEDFLPLAIFLVPVLYASTTFGLNGGLVVASVSAVATVPWAVQATSAGNKAGAWFDAVQVFVLLVLAYFVGKTVDAEREARVATERSRQDHLLAEMRYRDLFESNSQPIFLVDLSGAISEANVAAEGLFGHGPGTLEGQTIQNLIGHSAFMAVRAGGHSGETVGLHPDDGTADATFRPSAASSRSKASRCSRSCSWT